MSTTVNFHAEASGDGEYRVQAQELRSDIRGSAFVVLHVSSGKDDVVLFFPDLESVRRFGLAVQEASTTARPVAV